MSVNYLLIPSFCFSLSFFIEETWVYLSHRIFHILDFAMKSLCCCQACFSVSCISANWELDLEIQCVLGYNIFSHTKPVIWVINLSWILARLLLFSLLWFLPIFSSFFLPVLSPLEFFPNSIWSTCSTQFSLPKKQLSRSLIISGTSSLSLSQGWIILKLVSLFGRL